MMKQPKLTKDFKNSPKLKMKKKNLIANAKITSANKLDGVISV